MNLPQIVIIDSGICNLFNVQRALTTVGAEVTITSRKKDILDASAVVLPGVGAFGAGMRSLDQHDLTDAILSFVKSGKPLLGICLGMQLLLTESEEYGQWNGLGIIRGRVRALRPPQPGEPPYKIPHTGWSPIEPSDSANRSTAWQGTVLDGVAPASHMYFVHSYVAEPEDARCCIARTSYGSDRFCAVINWKNVSACQFHPERSGEAGLQILRRFVTGGVLAVG